MVETTSEGSKASQGLPPYVAYSAWLRLLAGLRADIPDRIDNSYLRPYRFNQATRSMLLGALRFLGLVDHQNRPTEELSALVQCNESEYPQRLRKLVEGSYRTVLARARLTRATPDQLKAQFEAMGAKGDVARKCVSFFVAVAQDAGMRVSPHLPRRRRQPGSSSSGRSGPRPKSPSSSRQRSPQSSSPPLPPQEDGTLLFGGLLSEKIAAFDSEWDLDTKRTWFEGLAHVLRRDGALALRRSLLERLPAFDPDWDDETVRRWLEAATRISRLALWEDHPDDTEE
ncbi:MAG: DUF5343 domain-containing protein [Dehalococcoidia bacterium]